MAIELTYDDALELIENERVAILTGNFARLGQLLPLKEKLVADMQNNMSLTQAHAAELSKLSLRNNALLNAAREGIRSVTKRLAHIHAAKTSLSTYDRSGKISPINTSGGKLEWKA
jgi:hypothetical protein